MVRTLCLPERACSVSHASEEPSNPLDDIEVDRPLGAPYNQGKFEPAAAALISTAKSEGLPPSLRTKPINWTKIGLKQGCDTTRIPSSLVILSSFFLQMRSGGIRCIRFHPTLQGVARRQRPSFSTMPHPANSTTFTNQESNGPNPI